ncbi:MULTISPECIES: hypothetical protein [Roseobacteraceae]|uniref:hypothetical protein n=1 Tax=Roseobacteraceae TaxID=2854170 RepID=UPI0021A77FFF|nr:MULTISPECIES: hypothetical protein [Roseobacteraceae]UWQ48977.1 hypothetical protein K3720_13745 [Leisingera caerulea]
MKLDIDPAEVKLHITDDTLTHISYRGWSFAVEDFDYIQHRVRRYRELSSNRADFSRADLPGVAGADMIRERVAAMSNHQRIEFIAAVQRAQP